MLKSIKWFEIPAADFPRAVKFYNNLLDITVKECDMGEEKMAFFPHEDGAISFAPDFNPSENGVLIYFDADGKLDNMLKKTVELGGSIIRDKCKIDAEGKGWFALVSDSEGNRIGFYTNN